MYDIRATHALVDEYVQNILPLKNIQSKHIPKNTQTMAHNRYIPLIEQ